MTATFKPGDRTVFHTHRFPVAVYSGRRFYAGTGRARSHDREGGSGIPGTTQSENDGVQPQ